jgi:hypothetical protein
MGRAFPVPGAGKRLATEAATPQPGRVGLTGPPLQAQVVRTDDRLVMSLR